MKKTAKYLLGLLKQPTTYASIAAVVAVFKPEYAQAIVAVTGALGVALPEALPVAPSPAQ